MLKERLLEWLKLPEKKNGVDLDAPSTTLLHKSIIRKKPFLTRLYLDFYREFQRAVERKPGGRFVELGSGGGFLKELIPSVVTTDILDLPNVDVRCSALAMPFEDGSVDGFFALDVLHHLPDLRAFLKEVNRCLRSGGRAVFIEPGNTLWGRFVYQNFHHEPFVPSAGWSLEKGGPLSGANGALPWIVFFRDREMYENEFPRLKIRRLRHHTPFRYLVSGGVSMRPLVPSFSYSIVRAAEWMLEPFRDQLGMFLTIELEKTG